MACYFKCFGAELGKKALVRRNGPRPGKKSISLAAKKYRQLPAVQGYRAFFNSWAKSFSSTRDLPSLIRLVNPNTFS